MEITSLTPTAPSAKTDHPATSHQAGEAVTKSGKRQAQIYEVVGLVMAHPGCTSRELAECTDNPDGYRYVIARRLPDAESCGWIERGQVRRCRISGMQALTWVVKGSANHG